LRGARMGAPQLSPLVWYSNLLAEMPMANIARVVNRDVVTVRCRCSRLPACLAGPRSRMLTPR
jgi:hypothetical protein